MRWWIISGVLVAVWVAGDVEVKAEGNEAVRQWVARALALPGQSGRVNRQQLEELVKALPAPEHWAELRRQVEAAAWPPGNYERGLRTLAVFLDGAEAERWQAVEAMRPDEAVAQPRRQSVLGAMVEVFLGIPVVEGPHAGSEVQSHYDQLVDYMIKTGTDGPQVARAVRHNLARGQRTVRVPHLVELLGEEEAEKLLGEMLRADVNLDFMQDGATVRLARRVALREIEQLKQAPWELAKTMEGGELFEAIRRRFPVARNNYEHQLARAHYFFGLLLRGETEAAEKEVAAEAWVGHYVSWAWHDLKGHPETRGLWEFLERWAARDADFPFWEALAWFSAQHGEQERLMALAEKVAAEGKAGGDKAWSVLLGCALASDRLDRARAAMEGAMSAPPPKPVNAESWFSVGHSLDKRVEMMQRWLKACMVVPELKDDRAGALDKALGLLKAVPTDNYRRRDLLHAVVEALLKTGRENEADALMAEAVAAGDRGDSWEKAPDYLVRALEYRVERGQHAEAVALLEKNRNWGVRDLAEVLHKAENSRQVPLGYLAALALEGVGRGEEARRILERMVAEATPYDGVYEKLLAAGATAEAGRLLDRGALFDRFEERPLIWKAEWLRRNGQAKEALTLIKQAVAMDPSDGETGAGRRMMAYVIWGRIAQDLKDPATVKQMKEIERAIRRAEEADRLDQAGLATRAIAGYAEALKIFGDAYCIQSRLAVRLASEGRLKEAAVHYERAFELMPDSFGRIESHCFGCEGVFDGQLAQRTAERVFGRMLRAQPQKPQLHYLMGYLEEESGRYAESVTHFARAVELDPDYINVWKKLDRLAEKTLVPGELADRAVLRVAELDPARRHVKTDRVDEVKDLRVVWRVREVRSAGGGGEAAGPLLALQGSATLGQRLERRMVDAVFDMMGEDRRVDSLTNHQAVRALVGMAAGN